LLSPPGKPRTLDIDFNACASIVTEGNGQFRLKPVLHAGEVTLTSSSINGTIVDSLSAQPVAGGNTVESRRSGPFARIPLALQQG